MLRTAICRSRKGRCTASLSFKQNGLKPLRFKRLLLAESEEEIIRQFRRAVDLAGDVANVLDLARLLLDWTDPDRSEKTRTRLAFNYFGARTAADDEGTTARSLSTA